MYKVTGERIETSTLDNQSSSVYRHDLDFSNYQSAVDYYENIFSDVSKDICHLGGEFVVTMIHNDKVIKRHVVSTTVNDEQHF
jgi:hypothetical protein